MAPFLFLHSYHTAPIGEMKHMAQERFPRYDEQVAAGEAGQAYAYAQPELICRLPQEEILTDCQDSLLKEAANVLQTKALTPVQQEWLKNRMAKANPSEEMRLP